MRTILTTAALAALFCTAGYSADVKAGEGVYDRSCKTCHGADGTPNPGIAKMMKVEIVNFKTTAVTDAQIKTAVTEGKGKMHAVGGVTGAALDNVIAYVHSLKK